MKGQAKKDFEKWYKTTIVIDRPETDKISICVPITLFVFNQLPPSMQYGVIVDWFDSVGIRLEIGVDEAIFIPLINEAIIDHYYTDSRPQARQKAIDKAVEIYNKRYESK